MNAQNVGVDVGDWIRPRLIADPEPVVDFDTGEVKINPKTGERDCQLSVAVRREGQRRGSAFEADELVDAAEARSRWWFAFGFRLMQ